MDLELQDSVVVLTGGASGLGRATSEAFVSAGARLVVLDRNPEALDQLKEELPGVETRLTDVSDSAQVTAAHDEVMAAHGRLDVAVNNAGINRPAGWFHDLPEETWDDVVSVNLKGVWLCMRAQLGHMYRQRHGVIVNTASSVALVGAPGASPYTAAKHGVLGLTRTAALEYAPLGIRVNAVAPGTVQTGMSSVMLQPDDPFKDALVRQGHPLKPTGTPEEVADAILFLASPRSSFATGSVLVIDGGLTAE